LFKKEALKKYTDDLKKVSNLSQADKEYCKNFGHSIKGTIDSPFFKRLMGVVESVENATKEKIVIEADLELVRLMQGEAIAMKSIIGYVREFEAEIKNNLKEN